MNKRLTLLSALLIIVTLGTSCTQEYVCQCTLKFSGQPGLPDSSIKQATIKDTKSKAKSTCENSSATYTQGNITTVETCTLY